MISPKVYFVAHHLRKRWPELLDERATLPMGDIPATRWAPLENIWIVSTYLRLRNAGHDVRIVERPVSDSVNVCCENNVASAGIGSGCFVVLTQGDREQLSWADHSLVQSPEQLTGSKTTLIKHWPQPGLIGRDASRGGRIERMGYIGPLENLAAAYRTDAFRGELAKLGVELVIRDRPEQWHDFSDLDLFIAVRDWPWHLIKTKPATKLVHAWLTGVPALLGPEPSFAYWGANCEDYFEVNTPERALAVVKRLKHDPALYESVRQRGFVKGRQHDEAAVIQQWVEVLNGPVRDAFERWRAVGPMTWKMRAVRRQWQRLSAPVQQKWFTLRRRGWRAITRKLGR